VDDTLQDALAKRAKQPSPTEKSSRTTLHYYCKVVLLLFSVGEGLLPVRRPIALARAYA